MFKITRLFLPLCLLAASACGGGGGGNAGGGDSETGDRYSVSVRVSGGGTADPVQQHVTSGGRAVIELAPDAGFSVGNASGCAGALDGTRYTTGQVTADCQVQVEFTRSGGVAGQLWVEPATVVDTSVNDAAAPVQSNNRCDSAQAIANNSVSHGFIAATPTAGDPQRENFAETADVADFYSASLNAGQTVELEVADYAREGVDVQLYLWNRDCSQLLDSATEGSDRAQLDSFLGGDSVIEVRAEAGITKYVMRVANAWNSYEAEELEAFSTGIPAFRPNEAIVLFEPGAQQPHEALAETVRNALGVEISFRHRDPNRETLARFRLPEGVVLPLPDALDDLRRSDSEASVDLNTLMIIDLINRQPFVRSAEPNFHIAPLRQPNDPQYSRQWHYDSIQLPQAWDLTTGAGQAGESVVVAVVDTGVYLAHADLQGKLLPGYDFHQGDADPDDYNSSGEGSWHGTHVAGTVAAATDNGTGVAGVSWAARVMPVRVLADDGGTRYDVMQGVRYAAGLTNDSGTVPDQPADVINMSLGGGGHSYAEESLYQDVRARSTIIIAAAGNEDSDQPMYPAAYEGVVSVSATACDNSRASYSNYGPTISLAAPGGNTTSCGLLLSGGVLSTIGSGSGEQRSSSYGWLMGTSMAAPHVAGVAALMRAVHPQLSPADFDNLLAEGHLTDELGEAGRDDQFGYGLLNSRKAVEAAQAMAEGGPGFSARVVAEPSVLHMGRSSEAELRLRQQGEGEAPAVADWQARDGWLSAVREDVDERGLGTYRVLIDRSHFSPEAAGSYQSSLVFSLEDGSALDVAVFIQVGYASEAAPIYVFLLDPQTKTPVYQTQAQWNSDGELRYSLEDVAPGRYLLLAGSDVDVDQLVCQPGEACGGYPALAQREEIEVVDQQFEGMDFEVDILSGFRTFESESIEAIQRRW